MTAVIGPLPLEKIPFHNDELLGVRESDQQPWILLKRCCECLGISYSGQHETLQNKSWATMRLVRTVAEDGRQRDQVAINLDTLLMWLSGIDENKVAKHAKEKIQVYQKDCVIALRNYFFPPRNVDPILAALEQIKETRLAQLETERKAEAARQLAQQARQEAIRAGDLAQAALDTARSNYGYYTVLGWARLLHLDMPVELAARHGRRLSAICRQAGVEPGHVRDPRFGSVNTYPQSVLAEYFGPGPA